MRPWVLLIGLVLVFAAGLPGAAPPIVPAEVRKLIDQLGDEDADVRKTAMKKLEALGEDVVSTLRAAAQTHSDVDVRLRATVVAVAIEKKVYGEVRRFVGHKEGAITLALSPDGKTLASGSWHGGTEHAVLLWNVATGKLIRRLEGHTRNVTCVAFSADGKRLLSTSLDTTVRLWNVENGKELQCLKRADLRDHLLSCAISQDGKTGVSGGHGGNVHVWDLEAGTFVRSFRGDFNTVRGMVFLPDGKRLLTAGYDHSARLYDKDGKLLRTFTGHTGLVVSVAVSRDGKRVVSGSFDYTARVWDLETGKETARFAGHAKEVHGVAFSHDGKRVISSGYDKTAKVWNADTGKLIQTLEGHTDLVLCATFTRDGRHALTASYDKTLRMWKLRK
jgi:WD40 repeat protein